MKALLLIAAIVVFWTVVWPALNKSANYVDNVVTGPYPSDYCNNLRYFDTQKGVLYADPTFKPGGKCHK